MDKKVPAIGPTDAKIVIVGEAPGSTEERDGVPFVGLAGHVLNGMLEEVGLTREECYITNVHKYRPTANNFERIDPAALAGGIAELKEELMLVKPNVIVLCGNEALKAVREHTGISNWRGSVLESKFGKCIPIYHPAAIAREWRHRPLTVADLRKVKAEQEYPEIRRIDRHITVMPTYEEAVEWLNALLHRETVSFDIEVETGQISCIAFAASATTAISVPFWFGSSGSYFAEDEEMELWKLIKLLLEDKRVNKIAQNAQYDMTVLRDIYNINVTPLSLDTMIAFHAVYPELPKSLATLASVYTDVPYYKYQRRTDDMTEFFRYNAMDALVTYECAEKIQAEMKEVGVEEFYYEHMHSLIDPLLAMSARGVRVDSHLKKQAAEEYRTALTKLQSELEAQVGHPLNTNSPKQMMDWLYKELALPKLYRRRGRSRTITADHEALVTIQDKHNVPAVSTILQIREKHKILSTYLEVKYDTEEDSDGSKHERARTSYLITGTETGRLSSRETLYGTGGNLQNVPKGIARRIYVPDPERLFVNADLSQAEARVVAYLAGEDKLIKVFEEGGDIHRKNAATIFDKAEEEVTKKERELAKRVVHASNYGMGPQTFQKTAGLESLKDAKRLLNLYFATYPRIKLWQLQVASTLKRTRTLVTPLGRRRTFFNGWSDGLRKEAYAYVPQSMVADILNKGLRRCYDYYKNTDTDLLLQIHDAVLVQTPIHKVAETAAKLKEMLTVPVDINRRTLVIPVDVTIGGNWDELK